MSGYKRRAEEKIEESINKKAKTGKCKVWTVVLSDCEDYDHKVLGVFASKEDAVKRLNDAAVEYGGEELHDIKKHGNEAWEVINNCTEYSCWAEIHETSFYPKGFECWHIVAGENKEMWYRGIFQSKDDGFEKVNELKERYKPEPGHVGYDWEFSQFNLDGEIEWVFFDKYIKMYKCVIQ